MSTKDLLNALIDKIDYKPDLSRFIGVEREFFLYEIQKETDYTTMDFCGHPIVRKKVYLPRSCTFLYHVRDPMWTYELSACQVEHRTSPCKTLQGISAQMHAGQLRGHLAAYHMDARISSHDVASNDMPLTVYNDPRYKRHTKDLPEETLRAACMVAGTHIHIGANNLSDAIRMHNRLVPHLDELCALGDHSNGERLSIYKKMAVNWRPPIYENEEHFLQTAIDQGFAKNLRDCWHLIRISKHGTVELRMFGGTNNPEEIISWICHVRRVLGYYPS